MYYTLAGKIMRKCEKVSNVSEASKGKFPFGTFDTFQSLKLFIGTSGVFQEELA